MTNKSRLFSGNIHILLIIMRKKDSIFVLSFLSIQHLIVVDAGIHHSKYWMPILYHRRWGENLIFSLIIHFHGVFYRLETLRFLCLNERKVSLVAICHAKRQFTPTRDARGLPEHDQREAIPFFFFFNGVVIKKSSLDMYCTWSTRTVRNYFMIAP